MRSALMPRMKPAPPKICTASEAQNAMVCVAWFFIMQISATGFSPCPSRHASSSSIDWLAKGLALLGVGNGFIEADPGIGGAARRHADALAVEVHHDDLEAVAFLA